MAEVTIVRAGQLMRALIQILAKAPEGLPANEALKVLEQAVPPTAFENAEYPKNPGTRRFEKIVRFHSINLVKAGWVVKSSGIWVATPEGIAAATKHLDPEEFMREAIRLYREWLKGQPSKQVAIDVVEPAPDEGPDATVALEEAQDASRTHIESYLAKMPAYPFQDVVAGLLRAMGYVVLWIAPPGPDGGFDVLAQTDPLGAKGPRIKAEVKQRPDTRIGADDLRSFMATLGEHDVGIYISTGGFSKEAHAESRRQEKRRVTLIDLPRFIELWVEHYKGLSQEARDLLPLKAVFFLAPQQ